jgi:O-antigen/teichoic acid export membrane protein
MGLVQAGVAVLSVIDILFVSLRFGTTAQAARYQLSANLTRVPLFLALAFATAAFPSFARRPGDRATLSGHSERTLSVLLPILALLTTVPGSVLRIVLPASYAGAAHFLAVTAAISTIYGLVILQTTLFRAAARVRTCLLCLAFGIVVAVACMAALSRFGILGAGIGALIGATATLAALGVQTERLWPGAHRPGLRPLILWPCVTVVLVLLRGIPWLWAAVAVIVVAEVIRAALRAPRSDIAQPSAGG